jgi:hypothetical protein
VALTEGARTVTDISTGNIDPGDNKDADRKNLPMTQVDDEEVAAHSGGAAEAPIGEGVGIGGEPTPLPADTEGEGEAANDADAD